MSGALILLLVLLFDLWPGSNTKFSSSSENLDQDLAKIFDEILLQVFPGSPYATAFDGARTAGRAVTRRHMNGSYLQINNSKNSEFDSRSNAQEEHLAKIFDEILMQVLSKEPHDAPFVEPRPAGRAITRRHRNENPIPEEKRNKESSLFNRDVSGKLTTLDKGTLHGAVTPDVQSRSQQCNQLLHFLQKNIIIATGAAAAILAATVLLLLLLTAYIRRKQPLYPPANMTYNIFIMNGKSYWQKSQEKNLRKLAEKQPQLKRSSFV